MYHGKTIPSFLEHCQAAADTWTKPSGLRRESVGCYCSYPASAIYYHFRPKASFHFTVAHKLKG